MRDGERKDPFVVGSGNREACETALAAIRKPRSGCNPLVIYGDRGVGKTFLLREIERRARRGRRKRHVRYWTAHEYRDRMIASILRGGTEEFRAELAGFDLLLLDDIDSVSGRPKLQAHIEETVGKLCAARTLVIVAGLRKPEDVCRMTGRIWRGSPRGGAVRILRPDSDQKEAIIRRQMEEKRVRFPEAVVSFLAKKRNTDNLFRLNGMVNRIAACSAFEGRRITASMAREVASVL